jgi:hypothetical protein
MHGKSSWINEYAWIISTAAAGILNLSSEASANSPAAWTSIARTRLPPPSVE